MSITYLFKPILYSNSIMLFSPVIFVVWIEPVNDQNVEIEGLIIQARTRENGHTSFGFFAALDVGKNVGPYSCSSKNVSVLGL